MSGRRRRGRDRWAGGRGAQLEALTVRPVGVMVMQMDAPVNAGVDRVRGGEGARARRRGRTPEGQGGQ
jgi:hypothetical protein